VSSRNCWLFNSLLDSPRWSNMFLTSPGVSCVSPLMFWLWQVSPSTKKVGQLSTTSHPIPGVKLNAPPHPCCGGLALHFIPPPFWKARFEFHPAPALRGQLRGLPHPCQAELSYVLCLWCSDLCPPTLLDFVVPSRVVDL
jgi:hypothetical protein